MDDDGMNQTVLLKQLGLMGLKTLTVNQIEEIAAARPSGRDVIFLDHGTADGTAFDAARALCERFTPAGIFLLVSGPTKVPAGGMAFDRLLQRPVLREAMMDCLMSLEPPEFAEASQAVGSTDEPTQAANETDLACTEDNASDPPQSGGTENAADGAADTDIRLPTAPSGSRRQMRVLAAEDNRTNRFVFGKMLKDHDIDLVFVVNGLEAIELFSDLRPDIFFTDISMPKMDGKEATRRIRALEAESDLPPCPIVAITAHEMDGDADEILAAGVDHYLTKPLKKQQLISHILDAQPLDALPALPLPHDEHGDTSSDADQLPATAAE
ncbi:MAG: response regulator [Boseongicola sp.]